MVSIVMYQMGRGKKFDAISKKEQIKPKFQKSLLSVQNDENQHLEQIIF